jgi:APA family basic amino acid/polyamine antiporter
MTSTVHSSERSLGPPGAATLDQRAHRLGLPSATALVIGSIIGTGVFTMPAVMAGAGTSSIITLGIISVGAILLGLLFGQLTRRVPHNEGGLYAYARHEFGDFAGYATAWCYWITCWAGNAAIVSSWVLYVEELFGINNPSGWTNWGIALTGLWIPAIINLAGVKQMAWFQNVTVVLKFLPLLFVGVVGWFFVTSANFGPFNASGGNWYDALNIAAGVALFSFIGVETAAIVAGRVRNPRRNVSRAAVLGTGLSAVLYVAVTAAVMGLVPHGALVTDGAPFVAAYEAIFNGAGWAGKFVAVPYFIAATAQFTFLVSRRRRVQGWAFARDMSVAFVGLLFSLWVTFSSGYAAVYQALLLVLIGIPLYGFLKARRERLGQIEEIVDMPPELADEPPRPANA